MTSIEKDALATLLPKWQLDEREVAWLWYFVISLKGAQLDDCTLNSPLMREQIAKRLEFDRSRRAKAERGLATQLLPDETFQWIQKDGRQTDWLAAQARTKATVGLLHPPFTTMTGRRLVIAIFDIWETDIRTKGLHLRALEQEWNEHLQSDRIFRWFKQENEKEKCSLAWDWLDKNKPSLTRGEKPFTSHRELVAFFDRSSTSPDEKVHYVERIKRRWSTQKHRENTPNKKQYNFVLTDSVNAVLDQLAKDHQVSRTKILERLILSEAERKLYLTPED